MDGRKKLSGAAYKKLALAKKVKNEAIVKKCKNISEMFKMKNVVNDSNSSCGVLESKLEDKLSFVVECKSESEFMEISSSSLNVPIGKSTISKKL